MASFCTLAEAAVGQDKWDGEKDYSAEVVRRLVQRGLELRPDRDGESFWDDFIRLFGENREAAAELFGVRAEAVSRAVQRARQLKDEVSEENNQEGNKKKKYLHTGVGF